ncbi:putative carboxypeptidase [Coprinopsis sp. MPI-PUGE-AT-0042]|nr:putative carboxypeptidase [Coprinopsis sp. MPI-PUGE-AT-0042]
MKFTGIFALLALALPTISIPVHDHTMGYDGIKVLRIPTGNSTTQLDSLIESLDLSVWTHSTQANSHIDVQVPKDVYKTFTASVNKILKAEGVTYPVEIMHEDLGASIREEAKSIVSSAGFSAQAGLANNAWFNAYHPIADHMTWLSDLVTTFPDNAKIVSSGTSVQGRDIKGVNIFGSSGSGTKPAIIWHGTVHAREWISAMTVEYLAYNLLNNYANSTEVKNLVDKYDFYIFPIVNPDGFAYSQTSTRLWRKNRHCIGRDINRNWNPSTNPCDETYKGAAPVDAPETKGLAAFIEARAQSSVGAKMYVDWHSYSQLFRFPCVAPDDAELSQPCIGLCDCSTGLSTVPRYTTGPSCTTIYATTGSSDDAKSSTLSVAELRDTGANGSSSLPTRSAPTGAETWAGVKYLLANSEVDGLPA